MKKRKRDAARLKELRASLEKLERRLARQPPSGRLRPVESARETPRAEHPPRLTTVRLDVRFPGEDAFLRFLEELAAFDEVVETTVAGSRQGRASVIVRLKHRPVAEAPAVLCVRCGATLLPGSMPASHGICESCAIEWGR